ncbi:MAG TPA: HD domain-containing phosphohydrolase [Rectinemataceae bacterium]|nr:HD domain-containing phosphohydrolase [Rectinemataceae bacterium]
MGSEEEKDLLDLDIDLDIDVVDGGPIFAPNVDLAERARILGDPAIAGMIHSFAAIPEPIAIIDNSTTLEFLYKNDTCKALLTRYHASELVSFAAAIWQQMGSQALTVIKQSLADPTAGFVWKGDIIFRRRDKLTLDLKAHIFPLWPDGAQHKRPPVYSVYFDDVTTDRHGYQRLYLEALLEASLLKDNETGRHVQRVNFYSRRLALALYEIAPEKWPEVDRDFIEDIGWIAAMHDIGKIGVPERIIHKNGRLDETEWVEMREHPITGALILASYPNRMAQDIARSHHERWNGSGYPFNLLEDAIPLSARIVALADVYDALRARRPYKEPMSHETACAVIERESGSHFDPGIVDAFKKVSTDFAAIHIANADE